MHHRFQRQAIIGRGGSGFVYKGIDKQSGQAVALKIINLDTPEDEVADIQHEVALLTQLRDAPNVTKYYGCFLDGPRLWIAMELAQGGSVSSLMKACKDSIIEEKFMVVIIREVLMALAFLHKSSIIHRDIKAANILVAASGRVMLCDFGISALLSSNASKRNTLIGTPHWMAPEVANSSTYDVTADIWSLGIFAYEMAKGSPPHSDLRDYEVVRLIPKAKTPSLQEGDGSPGLREFISFCLQAVPSERLSADKLLKTKWIKNAAKTSISILSELVLRYEVWSRGKDKETTPTDDMPWDETGADGSNPLRESQQWEFNRLSRYQPTLESTLSEEDELGPDSKLTIRPPPSASTALPSSLRLLFPEEEGHVPSNPFSISHAQEPISISPAPLVRALDLSVASSSRQGPPTITLPATLPLQVTARPIKHDDSKTGPSDVKDKPPDIRSTTSATKEVPHSSTTEKKIPTAILPPPPSSALGSVQPTPKEPPHSSSTVDKKKPPPILPPPAVSSPRSTTTIKPPTTPALLRSPRRQKTVPDFFRKESNLYTFNPGPKLRPLDFEALARSGSEQATLTQLTSTVNDLTQLLSAVEQGLENVLQSTE